MRPRGCRSPPPRAWWSGSERRLRRRRRPAPPAGSAASPASSSSTGSGSSPPRPTASARSSILARRAGRLRWCGADLAAHCINDVLTTGAEPLFLLDYVAANRIDLDQVAELVEGAAEVCRAAGCAILGGETRGAPWDLPGRGAGLRRHLRRARRPPRPDRRLARRGRRRRRRLPVGRHPRERLHARPQPRRRRRLRRRPAAAADAALPRPTSAISGVARTYGRSRT